MPVVWQDMCRIDWEDHRRDPLILEQRPDQPAQVSLGIQGRDDEEGLRSPRPRLRGDVADHRRRHRERLPQLAVPEHGDLVDEQIAQAGSREQAARGGGEDQRAVPEHEARPVVLDVALQLHRQEGLHQRNGMLQPRERIEGP